MHQDPIRQMLSFLLSVIKHVLKTQESCLLYLFRYLPFLLFSIPNVASVPFCLKSFFEQFFSSRLFFHLRTSLFIFFKLTFLFFNWARSMWNFSSWPPAVEAWSLNHWTTSKVLRMSLFWLRSWRMFFSGFRILDQQFFLSALYKCSILALWFLVKIDSH